MNTTYFTNLLSPLAIMSITQNHWQESFRWGMIVPNKARLHSFFWVFPCFTRRNRSNINKVIGILAKYRITSQIFKIYAFSSNPSLKNPNVGHSSQISWWEDSPPPLWLVIPRHYLNLKLLVQPMSTTIASRSVDGAEIAAQIWWGFLIFLSLNLFHRLSCASIDGSECIWIVMNIKLVMKMIILGKMNLIFYFEHISYLF